ncbi:MAG: hypothetical protein GWM98_13580, partial [Nitrospinaceae bacterium]|nr:hypothetical protein [Nitrospinaceae bacterium]NIR55314.1 hypothetical protein [Nitrospinaceae bacterium]NIS85753.1 hypothetical protein [Nitrospinaceae bacterium]NIT82603.1 hypothetical protein [Nitrospinaceae bacterium]NIU44808.1 hypothetical protein [Nitrospinaceae bacterium]
SVQLDRHLSKPAKGPPLSRAFVEEQLRRTRALTENLNPGTVIDRSGLIRSRKMFFAALSVVLVLTLTVPEFLKQGFTNWVRPPQPARTASSGEPAGDQPAAPAPKVLYTLESLALNFHYPAYTRLPSKELRPAEGKIEVLPGTEVQLEAQINRPVSGGELVLNGKDHFAMQPQGPATVEGRFLVKGKGFYQIRVK